MARRPKLTQEMVGEAIRLKADGLSNGDIICALGIHESTFYRWIGDPKNRLQRALSEGIKKRSRRSSGCPPDSAVAHCRLFGRGQSRSNRNLRGGRTEATRRRCDLPSILVQRST